MRDPFRNVFLFWTLLLLAFSGLHDVIRADDRGAGQQVMLVLDPQESPSLKHFEKHLKEQDIAYTLTQDLTNILPDILYGVSIIVYDSNDIAKLEESEHVVSIHAVYRRRSHVPVDQQKLPATLNISSQPFPPHVQTGVDKLHELGYYGAGVKIAVVDTSADCDHPALGGGFGPKHKISFGYDLVGDEYGKNLETLGTDIPKPKANPCQPCGVHGTHVLGILGASDVGQGFTGVVPQATLGLYRIFGCGDYGSEDSVIIAALLRAVKDGANIITSSIGFPGGWGGGGLLEDTINKLVAKKNATILFAGGNEGADGIFYSSSPGSAANAISVGSVQSASLLSTLLKTSTGRELPYFTAQSFSGYREEYPVYLTGNSTDVMHDACKPLPKSTPKLDKYVVLIRRGDCKYDKKVANAKAKGAKRIIFYANSTAFDELPNAINNTRVAIMRKEDGEYIFNASKKDPHQFKLHFPSEDMKFLPAADGGTMSNFSTYGPNYDFRELQPAVSAIGGSYISTVPRVNGSYSCLSGTSMATPQLAGIAALVMSIRGKQLRGLAMRSRLASTAQPVFDFNVEKRLKTVVQQGGGLADAYCAAFANTSVSTLALSLNDSLHFNGTQTFSVTNEGPRTIDYLLHHLPAATIYTFAPEKLYNRPTAEPKQDMNVASLQLSPERLSVPPGESRSIRVIVTPPQVNSSLLPVYSGYIALKSDDPCESHTLPYYGSVGSLKDQSIIDRGPTMDTDQHFNLPHLQFDSENDTKRSFNREGELVWSRAKQNETVVVYRKNFGSPLSRFFVVEHHDRPSIVDKKKGKKSENIPKTCSTNIKKYPYESCHGVTLLGLLPDGDSPQTSRSSALEEWIFSWNGTMSLGEHKPLKKLANGKYRVMFEVLRMNADPLKPESYETWFSPVLKIKK